MEKSLTDYTHTHTDGFSTSVIDHFLMSPNLYEVIDECKAIHRGDNLSRHSPILLKVKVSCIEAKTETPTPQSFRVPVWESAREGEIFEYCEDLRNRLTNISCPSSLRACKDILCQDKVHREECDSFVLDTLMSMIESSFKSIPLKGLCSSKKNKFGKRRRIIPVKQEQEQ